MIISRSGAHVEKRSSMLTSWPNGYGLSDPAAIPPPGMGSMMRAGVPVTLHTALQVDAVMTSCRVLSNAIVMLGNARAYTEQLDARNRPFKKYLADQPQILTQTFGPKVMQADGMTRTVFSLAIFGEAFWYTIELDKLQHPTCVEVLNPALVEFKKDLIFYGAGSSKVPLDPERLTHIPFMALPGAERGLSSIQYGGVNFALALAAMEYGQRWFAQGASPSYILSTEQKLGQDEVRRIAEKFLLEHSGLQASHLPLVVDSGLKVEKVQSSPDEAQYLQTLEYARRVIAAYFGLPAHLVGGMQNSSSVWGGTIEQQSIQMTLFTLSGYIVRINEALSSLCPTEVSAALSDTALRVPDAAALAKLVQMLRLSGVETTNEIRVDYLGKEPIEGGDQLVQPLNSNTSPFVGGVFAEEIADELGLPDPNTAPPAGSDAAPDVMASS